MSEPKFTKGPLFVVQPEKWPFNIEIVDTAGELVFEERRHSYSTRHKAVKDVMNCAGFRNTREDPGFVDKCIAANERQLADAYLRAAAPGLLELVMLANDGVRGTHTIAWQEKARAAIAKALGTAP